VPPAAAPGPAPHRGAVLPALLHKHLQHAHVVARQAVTEGQAQVALVPGRGQGQNQPGAPTAPPPAAAAAPHRRRRRLGDGEVAPPCGERGDGLSLRYGGSLC